MRPRAVDVILKKRQGEELTAEEIGTFIDGYTRGGIPDYQASAFAMAVFFRGMTAKEAASLTEAMMRTGEVLDLSDLPGPKVDKHSTGGVGDKTSLILAPLVAACDVYVPMISGRGLGHTGGTLDKLEAIPGFNVTLSLEQFRDVLRRTHCGLIGQTPEIAPADRKLYALRDVTATVESLPLICASIMSKKMAEGIDALILDVKTGDGAFLPELARSTELARAMVDLGKGMGKNVAALVTDMDQPLGRLAGNSLEVVESFETLKGRGPKDLESLSVELAAWMLYLTHVEPGVDKARVLIEGKLRSGEGLRAFQRVIEAQGGDPRVADDYSLLPTARESVDVRSESKGYVGRMGCRALGVAAMLLGAGRETVDSVIDPAVGITFHKRVGDAVDKGDVLATLHVNARGRLDQAIDIVKREITVVPDPPAARPLIHTVVE